MKQQINLYLPELRLQKDWLNASNMGRFVLLSLLLLLLFSGWRYSGLLRLQGELEEAQAVLALATRQTDHLEQELGQRSADKALADRLRGLEESLQSKTVLLDFLDAGTFGNTAGFSRYLRDLSRYTVPDLQLLRLSLQAGGESVGFGGRVLRPETVPLFLQNLRQGSAYQGMKFEALRIEEEQATELLQFDVVSQATGS